MRASDLLSALVISASEEDYVGLFIEEGKELQPVVDIKKNGETIIFISGKGSPEKISLIYKLLMLNKRCHLQKMVKNEELPIYGFKEVDNKIVI